MNEFPLDIVDPVHYPNWDELLCTQPAYSFFHSAPWARILSESYQYRPLYFTRIQGGKLTVLVPVMEVNSVLTGRRGVGLPFTDYCEPVLPEKDGCREVLRQIIRVGRQLRWNSLEVRSGNGVLRDFPVSSSYYMHTLDLTPGAETLFRNFRDTTRRNIKKSMREGVGADLKTTADSVAAFYRLNCETRKEHGLPPQPYAFFRKIHEHAISRNLGFVTLATHAGRTIAGAIFFHSGEKIIYKYGASLRASQNLRANNLLMWKAIEWSSEKGYKKLCFGRTDQHHAGLRQFKTGWGGSETIINYYKYDLKKEAFVEGNNLHGGIHTSIWKHVPIPVSKIAGRILYRHVG